MSYDVIFICHGNVNRSRIAEDILRKLRPDLKIDSVAVGVKSKGGKLFTKKMREIANNHNIPYDINKRSKEIILEDIILTPNVFIMDENNRKHFIDRFGDEYSSKLKLLGDLNGFGKIPDPGFAKGVEKHLSAFNVIKDCCEILATKI